MDTQTASAAAREPKGVRVAPPSRTTSPSDSVLSHPTSSKIPIRSPTPDNRSGATLNSPLLHQPGPITVSRPLDRNYRTTEDAQSSPLPPPKALPRQYQKRVIKSPTSLTNKPLPQTPVLNIISSSPEKVTRTLLDATDVPLRRSPGTPEERDWPALRPGKTPPFIINQPRHKVSDAKERDDVFGNPNSEQGPNAYYMAKSFGIGSSDQTSRSELSPGSHNAARCTSNSAKEVESAALHNADALRPPSISAVRSDKGHNDVSMSTAGFKTCSSPSLRVKNTPRRQQQQQQPVTPDQKKRYLLNAQASPSTAADRHMRINNGIMGYRVVRLSQGELASEYGPTLTISKSADRVLMGASKAEANRVDPDPSYAVAERLSPHSRSPNTPAQENCQQDVGKDENLPQTERIRHERSALDERSRGRPQAAKVDTERSVSKLRRPCSPHSNILIGSPPASVKREKNRFKLTEPQVGNDYTEDSSIPVRSSSLQPLNNPNRSFSSGHGPTAQITQAEQHTASPPEATPDSIQGEKLIDKHATAGEPLPNEALTGRRSSGAIFADPGATMSGTCPVHPNSVLDFAKNKLAGLRPNSEHSNIPNWSETEFACEDRSFGRAKEESKSTLRRPRSRSRRAISNIKGLFRRNSTDQMNTTNSGIPSVPGPASTKERISARESMISSSSQRQITGNTNTKKITKPGSLVGLPKPSDLRESTTTALAILERATKEPIGNRRQDLLYLAQIMIDAITNAREAEKAMHVAQQAANEAKLSYEMTRRSVAEIGNLFSKAGDTLGVRQAMETKRKEKMMRKAHAQ